MEVEAGEDPAGQQASPSEKTVSRFNPIFVSLDGILITHGEGIGSRCRKWSQRKLGWRHRARRR